MRLRIAAGAAAGVLIVASVATMPKAEAVSQSPLFAGARIDEPTLALFRRACQDCHSERTSYPWYSYVAPMSLLVRQDVARGRQWFNMSRWDAYPLVRKERLLSEIANQVEDRDMPLRQYTIVHREARLSDDEVEAIFRWTQAERSRLIAESAR